MFATDPKYGPILRKVDVEAILKQAGVDSLLETVVADLEASGHDFHFGADEPVVVFRAQDQLRPKLLTSYHNLCAQGGSPAKHLNLIFDARDKVAAWQEDHFTKVPSSDSFNPDN